MFYGVSAKCLCLKVMEFSEFEYILSAKRMRRYKDACGGGDAEGDGAVSV